MVAGGGQVIDNQADRLGAEALTLMIVVDGKVDPGVAVHRVRLLMKLDKTDHLLLVFDHQHGRVRVAVGHQFIDVVAVRRPPPTTNAVAGQQGLHRSFVTAAPGPDNEAAAVQSDPGNAIDSHGRMVALPVNGRPALSRPPVTVTGCYILAMAAGSEPTGISVIGIGRVALTPEIATLDVGVSLEGTDLASLHQAAATKLTAARTYLGSVGVDGPDITTSTLNVRSFRDHQSGRRTFHVSSRLTAVLRNIEGAGSVVNDLFGEVGEGLEMNGLSFDVEDRRTGHRDALALAFEDGRANALVLAERAGVSLGDVLAVVEQGAGGAQAGPAARGMLTMSNAAEMPVEAGELVIETAIEVRFAIDR